MDKAIFLRKRLSNPYDSLPEPPPDPQKSESQHSQPEAFQWILSYKDRQTNLLKATNESIQMDCDKLNSDVKEESECAKSTTSQTDSKSSCELLREECEQFIMPLLGRCGPSISAALVANDALEQLNRLHGLLDQMLSIQEQNYQMRQKIINIRTLCELKQLQKRGINEILNEDELLDPEFDLENQISLLSTILAAGKNASSKRNVAKDQRQRSKSVIADDLQMFMEKDNKSMMHMRRQSEFGESKSKVSKWTKVKAAFKWERANVPALNEGKSSDPAIGLTPLNNEVARYLRVPSVPCTSSSIDSILSTSSGHLLSCGSVPATPGTISSASSIEEIGISQENSRNNRNSIKSESRYNSRVMEDETRRSRSLDGDAVIISTLSAHGKNKTPWRKVKDIIQTHRGSFKGKTISGNRISTGSTTASRDVSPCESLDAVSNSEDRNEVLYSNQTSPVRIHPPPLNIVLPSKDRDNFSHSSSSIPANLSRFDDYDGRLIKIGSKGSRKSKILSDFESLPEDMTLDSKTSYGTGKPPPSPLNLIGKQDFSNADLRDASSSPTLFSKNTMRTTTSKKIVISGNSSVPSSPSKHSEFFGEFESEELSSGDFSEPSSPHRKLSTKSSLYSQQEEINERYMELKHRLAQEFENKRLEWEKIRVACSASNSGAYQLIGKDDVSQISKNVPTKLLEENLSPDFRKKLHKWRVKKQASITNIKDPQTSPIKEGSQNKIDWNLWKTGQIKVEGQGLSSLPDQRDLPEDFQKKLEEWKRMKQSNSRHPIDIRDSLRRQSGKLEKSYKCDISKKSKEDKLFRERQRFERDRIKSFERDKSEKLSKLKSMVTELSAKEIEVRTSGGVMKFEGISRKFTRKLYEWEKARGIGPESSTFALLHPGYRPLDVGNGSRESKSSNYSPALGRSLSLDSITPNPSMPSISHQPSSLSLNDVDEFIDSQSIDERGTSNVNVDNKDSQDEPEAVIVEVEDDIVETAAPLITGVSIVEQHTPVYKYEVTCKQRCAGTAESVLHRIDSNRLCTETLDKVINLGPNLLRVPHYQQNAEHIESVLKSLRDYLPILKINIQDRNLPVDDTFGIVDVFTVELMEMLSVLTKSPPINEEKLIPFDYKLDSLKERVKILYQYTDKFAVSITRPIVIHPQYPFHESIISDQADGFSNGAESFTKKVVHNTSSCSKKKTRLRKMGSRQNSKTESDSDEEMVNVVLEVPKRLKRKCNRSNKPCEGNRVIEKAEEINEEKNLERDTVYILKIKPGQKIEQKEIQKNVVLDHTILNLPTEPSCKQLVEKDYDNSHLSNVFVKTERKIFTSMGEEIDESQLVIPQDIESINSLEQCDDKIFDLNLNEKENMLKNLPPIPQSLQTQRPGDLPSFEEPSPSIRMMIAKYNKVSSEKSNRSSISSGSWSPTGKRSPVLDRNVRKQTEKYEQKVVKSASVGNIGQNTRVASNENIKNALKSDNKIIKSLSTDMLPKEWRKEMTVSELKNPNIKKNHISASNIPEILNKNTGGIPKNIPYPDPDKKEHLYRKNKEKSSTTSTKATVLKKIGIRHSKSDNIGRKMFSIPGESWGIFLENADNSFDTDIQAITDAHESGGSTYSSWSPSFSPPVNPLEEPKSPKTPLSERALKLQKAKEDFLRAQPMHNMVRSDEGIQYIWKNRLSQISKASSISNDVHGISKSASVGMLELSASDNDHIGGYDSLPRDIGNPSKIPNKLGFSTLASKLKKATINRDSKGLSKMNAVSTLCQQSFTVGIVPETFRQISVKSDDSKGNSWQSLRFGSLFKKNS